MTTVKRDLFADPALPPGRLSAEAACAWQETLLPAARADLPNPLVFANFAEHGEPFWRHRMLSGFAACRAGYGAIKLVRYPPGTIVDASQDYATLAAGEFVEEQIPDLGQDDEAALTKLMRGRAKAIPVMQECLLLASTARLSGAIGFSSCWRKPCSRNVHHPGRFRIVIGSHAASSDGTRGYLDSVMESLASYGIAAERIVALDRRKQYRFEALFDISGLRDKPHRIHPGIIELLRHLPALATLPRQIPRLAVCRNQSRYRSIQNHTDLRRWFAEHDFMEIDLEQTPFPIQVELFRQAELVIASLGSDCTGLAYCPPGTRVITLAPAGWPDDYFTKLLQSQDFIVGDVRGPSTRIGSHDVALTSHVIDPARLDQAFHLVAAFSARSPPGRIVEIDGDVMPRYHLREVASIKFGLTGDDLAWLGTGWGDAEANLRWSIGPSCSLHLPAGFLPAGDLLLEIEGINAIAPPHLVGKPLSVQLNGRALATFTTLHHDRLLCRIAADWIGDGDVNLLFLHPISPSPRSIGVSDDDRSLGFGFIYIKFLDPSADTARP